MKPPQFNPSDLAHTGLSSETWMQILKVLADTPEVEQAVLYGSRALGTHHKASDIDITLKGSALSHEQLNQIATQLDDLLLPWKMDLSLYDELSNPDLMAHIQRAGVVVYERGSQEA